MTGNIKAFICRPSGKTRWVQDGRQSIYAQSIATKNRNISAVDCTASGRRLLVTNYCTMAFFQLRTHCQEIRSRTLSCDLLHDALFT